MHKGFMVTASLLGALAVGLGAFGAHGLKKIVPPETVTVFQTGVQYQMYHVMALFITAVVYGRVPDPRIRWAGRMFVTGIILFSGSLYVLTLLKATDTVGMEKIGLITPLGGLAFITGWLMLALGTVRLKAEAGK